MRSPVRFATTPTALGWATVASAFAVLPATVRCAPAVGALAAWLALWGAAALVVGPTAALLRASGSRPRLAWALPVGVILALPVLTLFARFLFRTTHHRPLGAATFSVVGAAVTLVLVLLTARLLATIEGRGPSVRLAQRVLAASVTLAVAAEILMIHAALRQAGGNSTGVMADGGLAILATVLAWRLPEYRLPRWVGPALWSGAVALSAGFGQWKPTVREAVTARAPVLFGVADSLFGCSGRP